MEKNELSVSFSELLTDKLVSVEDALPKDFNRTRFVQNALAVVNENPGLAKINKNKLILGLLKGAYMGLDFMNKECYLIPYGSDVNFQADYKGVQKFVKKYSIRPILDIYAKIVREGDQYECTIVDNNQKVFFKPKPFSDEKIVGAFAVVTFKDGGSQIEEMSKKDIEDVRNSYSKAANSKAWKNSWSEMARKTVLRRLCKHIECDFESVEAEKAWSESGDADFSNTIKKERSEEIVDVFNDTPDVMEAEAVEVEAVNE